MIIPARESCGGMTLMDEARPTYYAVIPADVRYDEHIPANAKLLYGEISALIGADGCCFASNAYFASVYKMSERTISGLISKLQEHNYIDVVLKKDPKTGQVLRRLIYLKVSSTDERPLEEIFHTPGKSFREGIENFFQDTNLSNTVKKKVKKENTPKVTPEPLTDEQLRDAVIAAITKIAQPSWSKDVKNEMFKWVMEMYNPDRVVKKAHPVRSQKSVDAMFQKLSKYGGTNPDIMICMLCSAIEAGWQGVQPPNGNMNAVVNQKPKQEEREYRCV